MNGCIGIPYLNLSEDQLKDLDVKAKRSGVTIVKVGEEYRFFKTGTLGSRNEEYPSGLITK